jgi:phosphoglycolate phosphatase-like HAD superfamily hydrolase
MDVTTAHLRRKGETMTRRRLLLFDVDGVLVDRGELRRLPGAAEALAQLRHGGDAVLSLLTGEDEDVARHKTTVVGVERYLDFAVGGYGSDGEDRSALVSSARRKAENSYGCAFSTLVVTADSADQVALARADADLVVAVAETEAAAAELWAAGADHVLANLTALVPLATVPELAADVRS